jgi:DeoR family glycerol-3-phosphate regulon repressor
LKPKQRQGRILEVVGLRGETTVEALAEEFRVSAETIRRDLARLAGTGALMKVHGGARRMRLHAESSFQDRMADHAEAKAVIARKLAALIEPGDTLFMDTGTTTLACAEVLAGMERLTVVTNSLRIAQVLGTSDSHVVYLLGGRFGSDNAQTAGPMALEAVRQFQADHAILTVSALDCDVGAMDADFDEAQIAREMIGHARNTIVLAHLEKLDRRAAFRVCRLDEIDVLVCDQAPDDAFAQALSDGKVEVR